MIRACRAAGAGALVALIFLCLAWELWGAPLHSGGSWLAVIKTVPLLAALNGILAGRRYTYKWTTMLVLAYFIEGAMRAYAEAPPGSRYALAEAALAATFFVSATLFLRATASDGRSTG